MLGAVSFDAQEKKRVFSPFSLNAKLVGHLYECLAPSEGEVRGVCVCEVSTCMVICFSHYVVETKRSCLISTSASLWNDHYWFHLLLSWFVKIIVLCFIHHLARYHCCFSQLVPLDLRSKDYRSICLIPFSTCLLYPDNANKFFVVYNKNLFVLLICALTPDALLCLVCVFCRTLRELRSCWEFARAACLSTETGCGSTGLLGLKYSRFLTRGITSTSKSGRAR